MLSRISLLTSVWIVFFSLTSGFWIFKNTLPPAWDDSNYLEASEILYQSLTNDGVGDFFNKTTIVLGRKAPLIAILPTPLYLLFGPSHDSALMVNIVFFVIFAIVTFLLVRDFFDEKVAFVSILIVSTMPLFYGLVRHYFVEFGLMTIVVVWIYFLVKSKNLKSKPYLALVGITSGMGMLMKFDFFLFVVGPFVLMLYQNRLKNPNYSWSKWLFSLIKKLSIPFALALLVTLPWYSKNILTVLWHIRRATSPELLGSYYYGSPFLPKTIYLTSLDFINYVISSFWFMVLLILLAIAFLKKVPLRVNYLILSWFAVPFVIFFFGPNKDYRLMLPLLPPVGIFLSWLYFKVLGRQAWLYLPLLITVPVLILLNSTLPGDLSLKRLAIGPMLVFDNKIGDYIYKPKSEYWAIREALNFLNLLEEPRSKKIIILASEHKSFNINNLQYIRAATNLPLVIKTASYFENDTSFTKVKSQVEEGDYLVMKVGGNSGPANLNRFSGKILENLNWQEIPNAITFPDGGRLFVAKKPLQD